ADQGSSLDPAVPQGPDVEPSASAAPRVRERIAPQPTKIPTSPQRTYRRGRETKGKCGSIAPSRTGNACKPRLAILNSEVTNEAYVRAEEVVCPDCNISRDPGRAYFRVRAVLAPMGSRRPTHGAGRRRWTTVERDSRQHRVRPTRQGRDGRQR